MLAFCYSINKYCVKCINCINCTNYINCTNCTNCTNCINYTNYINCTNCINCNNYYYLFYLLLDSVPFSGPCRLLPIYIGKIPIRGKNLSVFFQLVLCVLPSPSLYIFVSQSALCIILPKYIRRSRGEGGSRRVWRFVSILPIAKWGVTSP